MSLKDSVGYTDKISGIKMSKDFEVISWRKVEDAISSYLDAVEHPEKYPEIIKIYFNKFISDYHINKKYFKDNDAWFLDLIKRPEHQVRFRDFCFSYFIGGRE